MYDDVVTLFNRYENTAGDVLWYPSVIKNVNLLIDKGSVVARYGEDSRDEAILNVRYRFAGVDKMVGNKKWVAPKQWKGQAGKPEFDTLTFNAGESFDFFMLGEWDNTTPIPDYEYKNGFYNHMKKQKDYVFAITSVSCFKLIPHFEITGK